MLTKLILEKYIPLLSSGINRVELDTTEKINLFISSNGSGKAQPLDCEVKVPNGWSTIGQMQVGTTVLTNLNREAKVVAIDPQGITDVVKLTFEDGRSTRCNPEHLWDVYSDEDGKWSIKDTKTLIKNPTNYSIPLVNLFLDLEDNTTDNPELATLKEILSELGYEINYGVNEYQLNSPYLIDMLTKLSWELGFIAKVMSHVTPNLVRVTVPSNGTQRKLKLVSIERCTPEFTQCIEIDSPDSLYVTDNSIVTHNSSILKELNQLPPENSNYEQGRKFTETYHNGLTYVLDSYTGVSSGHSFVTVDQEGTKKEHNPNGTYTVQLDLVKQHFGLDKRLVKTLNGVKLADRVSIMSANSRKDLLMQVYPNDTEYALSVYNKLRVERNELKAAIKNQVSRHAEETRKLKDLDQVGLVELERRINQFEDELKQCLLIRGGLGDLNLDPNLTAKINEFSKLVDWLTLNRVSGFKFTEEELANKINLAQLVEQHHRDISRSISVVINENRNGLDGLEEFLKDPDAFKEQAEQVEQDYNRTKEQLSQLDTFFGNYELFKNIDESFNGLETIATTFSEYLGRVTVASIEDLSSSMYKNWIDKSEQLGAEITNLVNQESNLSHKLKHYEQADLIECPDCESKFKVGISKSEIDNLRLTVQGINKKIETLRLERTELNKKIDNDSDWFNSMSQLLTYVRENSNVRILPELIKGFNVGKEHPSTLQNVLYRYSERFKLLTKITALESERNVIKARLDVLERNNLLDVAKYLKKLEADLVQENYLIRGSELRVAELKNKLWVITNHKTKLIELKELKEEIFNGLEEDVKSQLKVSVDKRISELTTSKEMCLASIIKSRSLSSVVESITDDLTRLKKRLKAVEILITGLCPNRGLIGKMMFEFIEAICGNMNSVIKDIWETPLLIKPSGKENGELTYKFPVITGDRKPSPDISDCSAGESDIIDWAFRFVLLNYVVYPFPLIMDEVGVGLDEIKRGRFFNFIKEYTERKDARQLFMVSHYFVQYAVFKDVNMIGLKYEGLTVNGDINQNTVVE